MTKSRDASNNVTEDAVGHVFDNQALIDTGRGATSSNTTLGAATVNQTKDGQTRVTSQAALEQLGYSAFVPINGVVITTTNESPSGSAFVEDLTVTGTSTGDFVRVYGFEIPVAMSDTNLQVTTKVVTFLALQTSLFSGVVNQGSGVIRVTHRDLYPHPNEDSTVNGISVVGTTITSSANTKYCYGTWTQFHSETKGTETIYYWKRTQ